MNEFSRNVNTKPARFRANTLSSKEIVQNNGCIPASLQFILIFVVTLTFEDGNATEKKEKKVQPENLTSQWTVPAFH